MDIKRMKKSELIELNGQLNESRIHCDAVIEALRAELAAAKAEIEALRALADAAWADVQERAESPVTTGPVQGHPVSERVAVRNNKLIHEFDPEVQGSDLAAMRRCRELGGSVRRARQ